MSYFHHMPRHLLDAASKLPFFESHSIMATWDDVIAIVENVVVYSSECGQFCIAMTNGDGFVHESLDDALELAGSLACVPGTLTQTSAVWGHA